jgi:hypothetical protein
MFHAQRFETQLGAGSLAGFGVLPPEEQANDKTESTGAKYEGARDGNGKPGKNDEPDGDNRADRRAGYGQAAVSTNKIVFAFGHDVTGASTKGPAQPTHRVKPRQPRTISLGERRSSPSPGNQRQ